MGAALLATGAVVFVTHGLEAITGFGCTVLAMPFVTLLLGLGKAKFLLAVLAWALALYFAVSKFKKIVWKEFLVIAGLAGAGMPLGMWAFAYLDRRLLVKALGVFIVLSAGLQLWKRLIAPRLRGGAAPTGKGAPKGVYWALLFAGGVVHGAFATGGPLIVLYASRALPDKGAFRATLTLLWATLNSVLMVQFFLAGGFDRENLMALGAMAPFLAAGIVAGEVAHRRVDEDRFAKIVFSMLFATGIIMLAV